MARNALRGAGTTLQSGPMKAIFTLPGVLACGLTVLLAAAGPARAEFSVCNQTLDVVNVAIGQQEDQAFTTQGWWTIGSNQCALVIREELRNRYIFVYANDVFGQPILRGTQSMCIAPKRFSIDGVESCWARGFLEARFLEVDTQAVERWTLFLSEPED
jgi:uncharacterized membrane protein